jgi:hypothetical protein
LPIAFEAEPEFGRNLQSSIFNQQSAITEIAQAQINAGWEGRTPAQDPQHSSLQKRFNGQNHQSSILKETTQA